MAAHPECSNCGMVLVWATIDGKPALVCPRVSCVGHGRKVAA
jgi:hypothetical protein